MQQIPLSLYIHFPWCIKKCPYCDFNSHSLKEKIDEKKYIDTLFLDFKNEIGQLDSNRQLVSIFMGGGTPSLFSGNSIKQLLESIRQEIHCKPDIEITMEANPGTLEYDQFENYLDAGVNRLSLGVQSFNNQQLKALGRIHSAESAINACSSARSAGFNNINLDIMFGLPDQSLSEALDDCARAIIQAPDHLSFYQLTIEPNTEFHKFPPQLPDDDTQSTMQTAIVEQLESAGYKRYEVSAYAKQNMQCQHNLNYWEFGDYLGIGPGAHSKISQSTVSENNPIVRTWKQKQPKAYEISVNENEQYRYPNKVAKNEILFECMLNALRLKNGIDIQVFQQRTGLKAQDLQSTLEKSFNQGLLEISENRIKCTEKGYLFIDEILQQLV